MNTGDPMLGHLRSHISPKDTVSGVVSFELMSNDQLDCIWVWLNVLENNSEPVITVVF